MASTHASHQKHPWHLVDPSPWPVMGAISGLVLTVGGVIFMHGGTWLIAAGGFLLALLTMFMWWRDVIREAEFQGHHTNAVQVGLRFGMAAVELAVADDALGLRTDVDEDLVLVDADHGAFDDIAVLEALDVLGLLGEELLHRGRLGTEVARRRGRRLFDRGRSFGVRRLRGITRRRAFLGRNGFGSGGFGGNVCLRRGFRRNLCRRGFLNGCGRVGGRSVLHGRGHGLDAGAVHVGIG